MLTPQLSFAWSVSKSNIHHCNMNVIRGNMMSQNPNTSEFRMNSVTFQLFKVKCQLYWLTQSALCSLNSRQKSENIQYVSLPKIINFGIFVTVSSKAFVPFPLYIKWP